MNKRLNSKVVACTCALVGFACAPLAVSAAENLHLAPGLSFTADIGAVFPILGEKLNDFVIEPGRPALIFFGAPGDLNTNRQAKRLVQAYNKHRDETKFIIVNVDDPNPASRQLVKKYYGGYVPAQLLLDKDGNVLWSEVGEIPRRRLRRAS